MDKTKCHSTKNRDKNIKYERDSKYIKQPDSYFCNPKTYTCSGCKKELEEKIHIFLMIIIVNCGVQNAMKNVVKIQLCILLLLWIL